MKKTALLIAVLALMTSGIAYADSTTFTPDQCSVAGNHRVYDQDNTAIVGCIPNWQWDASMAAQAGNGQKLPIVAPGATVTDEHGIVDNCGQWINAGCVDMTHTDAYRTAMKLIAKQLVGLKLSTTRFDGWIASVR